MGLLCQQTQNQGPTNATETSLDLTYLLLQLDRATIEISWNLPHRNTHQ